jgi:predicted dinucleotide-binding enzyme
MRKPPRQSASSAITNLTDDTKPEHTNLSRAGYEVGFAKKEQIAETAYQADVIFIAVPFHEVRDVARALESATDGKTSSSAGLREML